MFKIVKTINFLFKIKLGEVMKKLLLFLAIASYANATLSSDKHRVATLQAKKLTDKVERQAIINTFMQELANAREAELKRLQRQ